jgi:hypothetical protein
VIYTIATSQYSTGQYSYRDGNSITFDFSQLPSKHTYIVILCCAQMFAKEHDVQLTTNKAINLLYKSPAAVNKNPGHGTKPRNTVYVFYKP